ncbi:MAG: TraB/GumN family protein [Chitinophagaceae bacterium]|nr:TraB/GumN family protein [Chitinophagaceae bacterium]
MTSRKKSPNYDRDGQFSSDRLQESYRTGNLDWLDSINRYNSTSAAFDEKFLYKRNEIQANSIDSIIRKGYSLFVGVGAAHLPGDRGVIEMLRAKGYKLRAVQMGARDSEQKGLVEKLRVPVTFKTWSSEDGRLQVDVPGNMLDVSEEAGIEQLQYADMANGSYYMVSRLMTNAWLWNHSAARVLQTVDSLLYENIPGKILSKKEITKNGYSGFDIVNKTRRGDVQRYQIIATPFELLIFKLSGTGEYVVSGDEADLFFNSIRIGNELAENWSTYAPSFGGFSVLFPHKPFVGNDGSWIFDAVDVKNNNQYRVIRSDVHNHYFAEQDSFDLGLMEESFAASEFIEKRISRKNSLTQGYPSLDVVYTDKAGKSIRARFIIQGPHYYTILTRSSKAIPLSDKFFQSFKLTGAQYGPSVPRVDSSMYFSVRTPFFPMIDSGVASMPIIKMGREEREKELDREGAFRWARVLANDSTGERINVSFIKYDPYISEGKIKESNDEMPEIGLDSTMITRSYNRTKSTAGFDVQEWKLGEKESSRVIWVKRWAKDDVRYDVSTQIDSLTKPSLFLTELFDTFTPFDSIGGKVKTEDKIALLLNHFSNGDSTARRRAIRGIENLELDSSHLTPWKNALQSINWKEKDYLSIKKSFIRKVADIKSNESSDLLVDLFHAAGDTLELQNTALETLLRQRTKYSYQKFREIVSNEPPIIEAQTAQPYLQLNSFAFSTWGNVGARYKSSANGNFFDELTDSLELTKEIIPDLLPLLNLHEYKEPLMQLLSVMGDSGYLKTADYEAYYGKFLLEARMEYRRQAASMRQHLIDKARIEEEGGQDYLYYTSDEGYTKNSILGYLKLLIPFWQEKTAVPSFVDQMLRNGETPLKFDVVSLLLKKGKAVPDSLIDTLAAEDKFRFPLYQLLIDEKQEKRFPSKYFNHIDLARSQLISMGRYPKVDSIVYLDRIAAEEKDKKGFCIFLQIHIR